MDFYILSRFFLIILRKFDNRNSEKWWWERMATEDSSSGRKHRRHPFSSLILTEQLMRSPFMTFCKVHISWLWSITHVFPSTLPFLQVNYSPRGHSAFEASRPANGCWFLLQIRMNWENGMKWHEMAGAKTLGWKANALFPMISQRQSSILSRFLPVYPSARSAERKLSGSLRIRISELLSLRFFDEHGSSSEQIDPDQSKHITAVTLCTEY